MLYDLHATFVDVVRLRQKTDALPVRLRNAQNVEDVLNVIREARFITSMAPLMRRRIALAMKAHEAAMERAQCVVDAELAVHQGNKRELERNIARARAAQKKLERIARTVLTPLKVRGDAERAENLDGIFDAAKNLVTGAVNNVTSAVSSAANTAVNTAKAATQTVVNTANTVAQGATQAATQVKATVAPPATDDEWTKWCDNGGAAKEYGGDLKLCKIGSGGGARGAVVGGTPPWTIAGKQARFAINWGIPSPSEYDPEKIWVTAQIDPVRAAWLLAFATTVTLPVGSGLVGAAYVGAFMNTPVSPMGFSGLMNATLPLLAIRAAQANENFFVRMWRVLIRPVLGSMFDELLTLLTGGFTTSSAVAVYLNKEINRTTPPHSPEVKMFLTAIRDNIGIILAAAGVGPGAAASFLQKPLLQPQPARATPPPAQTAAPPPAQPAPPPTSTSTRVPSQTPPPPPTNGAPRKKSGGLMAGAVAGGTTGGFVGGPIGVVVGAAIGAAAGSLFDKKKE